MMSLQEWKELAMVSFALFTTALIIAYIILTIIARMKNKTQKRIRQQITHRYAKIDLCEYLTSKMKQEYIGQKKAFINQLVRM